MRKNRIPVIAVLMILMLTTFFAAGCGSTAQVPPQNTNQTPTVANPQVILATTTSTQDSGLLDVLVPMFEQKTGYKIKTVAVGSGAALTMGEKGEADVLLVHSPASEQKLVDNQTAINYQLVMHNDFILVGPASDPAKVKESKTTNDALKAIADKAATDNKVVFISRGDKSGTDVKEKDLWTKANIKPGTWYQETGSGMGATLTVASEKAGYTLSDRATYLANNKNLKLDIVFQGDPSLKNIYHVAQVNPAKFPKVNSAGAKAFVDFMINPDTQKVIGDFGKDKYGQALFFPDAAAANAANAAK